MAAGEATATPTPEELQAEVTRLRGENKTLKTDLDATNQDLRAANAEARDRRHDLKTRDTTIAELTADRDKFKGLAAVDADGWKAKYEATAGTLRGINHRKEFDALAAAAGVKDPSKVDVLYQISGYKPEKDEVDRAAITGLINTAVGTYGWLKGEAAAGAAATTGATTQAGATTAAGAATTTTAAGAAKAGAGAHGAQAGPGSDRGQSVTSNASPTPGRIPGRL